ncbi:DUF1631 family protein [Solemya velesiana gill symbiont]|uniref:DUF1631 domain-containing protein n=1 Tax=Solemya velesiana gill symbiont TaxID=1918948 RepID=A0A1T2KV93_9GAMM|nr:DUF1631 family protein [Solemya velesiana gill symbiont]OOZ36767.1 hypothetical protein BOW51_05715 [Solemya velesiana gill symbiont]
MSPALKEVEKGSNGQSAPVQTSSGFSTKDGLAQDLFVVLQGLLDQRRVESGLPHPGAPATLQVVETPELLGALHSLQETTPAITDNSNVIDLRGRLQQALGAGQDKGRVFGRAEEDVIDVIAMLFEYILDDNTIPDAMKALLARLQIPMLKVALQDREFFSNKSHPARQLLNNLARAAIGWTEGKGQNGGLYNRISDIVQRILGE